ncbi:tRNA (adenosine(37)-N6)-threonylcarbamoyltransferase complex dimerization subunit type 1 TsaB [Bdellovibrionota bacterium]
MATILAIETATPIGSVAIVRSDKVIGERLLDPNQNSATTLLPTIDELCKETNISLTSLDGIAVSTGPGMFTGLRVGISTAQGLAIANSLKLYAIPTLEAFAYSSLPTDKLVFMTIDARREEIYGALFKWNEQGRWDRLISEKVASPKWWLEALAPHTSSEKIIIGGSGYLAFEQLFASTLPNQLQSLPEDLMMPKAANVGILAQQLVEEGRETDPDKIEPQYLRKL